MQVSPVVNPPGWRPYWVWYLAGALSVFCACTHFGEQIRPTENPYEPVRGERCASQPVQDGVQTLKLSAVNTRGTDTISMRSRYRRTQLALVPKKLWTYETRKFA